MALGALVAGALGWFALDRGSSAPERDVVTFGDIMHPMSTDVLGPGEVKVTLRSKPPRWDGRVDVPWDAADAFTYSLTPHAFGTYEGLVLDPEVAEFHLNNAVAKLTDVTFVVTGRRFAIHYKTFKRSEARVWLDDRPVSSKAFHASQKKDGLDNWLEITLPEARKVTVRFEGTPLFGGVAYPEEDQVSVVAAKPPFTVGIISDSFYEPSPFKGTTSLSAAPTLRTLTGFRIWNMAQGGTGYLNTGANIPLGKPADASGSSPFGSEERMRALDDAPIDALIVNGTLNDGPPHTVAEFRAAVDRLLLDVEQRRPALPVILVGIEPISTPNIPDEPASQYVAMTKVLRKAAAEHDNVVGFVDTYSDNWFTGLGSAVHPTGHGNQDQYIGEDQIHPNGPGQLFYQGHIVKLLRKLPVSPFDAHSDRG